MSVSKGDPRFYPLRDAMFDNWQVAEALITQDPTVLEARSGVGETALHYLAIEKELEGVKWLFERGANLNNQDDFQSTPLMAAAGLGHLEMCRFLLQNGADVWVKDHIGRTALSSTIVIDQNNVLRVNLPVFELLLEQVRETDINDLFDDLDADDIAKNQSPTAERLRSLGLKARFDG